MTTVSAGAPRKERGFPPGARIRVRDEDWLVSRSEPVGDGHYAIHCSGLSELVRGHESIFLTTLDDDIAPIRVEDTELVTDSSPSHANTRLYLESLLRQSPATDEHLRRGHRAAMRASNYQLVPAQQALAALRPRILIADGVGLGKTLEVGVLLSELQARGRADRVLVVCMKSILGQFQKELWTRFSFPLMRLDSEGVKRIRQRIPTGKNPFLHYRRAIISIDTLKNDLQYRHWLEDCRWDVVVIDEVHNSINASKRNKVASILARTAESLILTSATPHNGKPESFATLMNMLEPTAIADVSNYTKEDIKGLYVRRFRKDVEKEAGNAFMDRDPKLEWVDASPTEEAVLTAIAEAQFNTLNRTYKLSRKGRVRDVLFKSTLLKAFLSSPQALLHTLEERIKTVGKRIADKPTDSVRYQEDLATLNDMRNLALKIGPSDFTKLEALFKRVLPELGIKGKKDEPRVVIFSERLDTLKLLRAACEERLKVTMDEAAPEKGSLAVITGSESDVKIDAVLNSFGSADGKVRVLLASEMASEGINLHHFCSRLVHFDVPWSFIRLEQRNGRIDRYGQKETPRIRYLLTRARNTKAQGDITVVEKLIQKEEQARKNLGDEAQLMGIYNPDAEADVVATAQAQGGNLDAVIDDIKEEQAQTTGAEDEDAVPAWLQELTASQPMQSHVATREPLSLFSDDLDYFKVALSQLTKTLIEEGSDPAPHFHEKRPEVSFHVGDDLKRRFEDMPYQALPEGGSLRLTTDRPAVEKSIEESRDKEGQWPDLHLLWEQHPALLWLNDRVLVSFGRQEAPLVVVPELASHGMDALALMEGTLSNKRGQAVVVRWFGLPTTVKGGTKVSAMVDLETVINLAGLRKKIPNGGTVSSIQRQLGEARAPWREAAEKVMLQLREERRTKMVGPTKDSQRRLNDWRTKALDQLEAKKAALRASAGKLGEFHVRRLTDDEERIEKLMAERSEWLKMVLSTDDRPHIRLAAVFAAR